MIQKIKKVYNDLNNEYLIECPLNDKKFRERVKKDLMENLGPRLLIYCDESNNPLSMVDMNVTIAALRWNENKCYHNCTLAFGTEDQIINTNEHLDAIQEEIISKKHTGQSEGLQEKTEILINTWEDKLARMMAERDFEIFGKNFGNAKIIGEKIILFQVCIEDLKKLI